MIVRKAMISDIEPLYEYINNYAKEALLLPRTRLSLYENIQNICVAVIDDKIVGGCGLHVLGRDLAEVRSLVVAPNQKGKGIGRKLVEFLLVEAANLGVEKVFSMTYQIEFFNKLGFTIVDKEQLPEKVWKDCLNCPKMYDCDETAMLIRVK